MNANGLHIPEGGDYKAQNFKLVQMYNRSTTPNQLYDFLSSLKNLDEGWEKLRNSGLDKPLDKIE